MSTELVTIPTQDALDRAVEVIQTAHPKIAEIPADVVRAGALLALQVGANPNPLAGELWIYPIQGRYTPYLGIAYYRRVAEERGARVMFTPPAGVSDLGNEPRRMTDDERAAYGVPAGVDASICRGFRGDRLVELVDRGIPWRDAVAMLSRVGVGYVRDDEKKNRQGQYMDPPNGRSWQWKCDKRAEVDLYKRLGVVAHVAEIAQAQAQLVAETVEPAAEGHYTIEDANADLFG